MTSGRTRRPPERRTAQAPKSVDVYLDSNLFAAIAGRQSDQRHLLPAVRGLLSEFHARVVGSTENLAEAFRISAEAERIRRVSTITQLVDRPETTPGIYLAYDELFRAIRVYRPLWAKSVSRSAAVTHLRGFRQGWDDLKRDPHWLPPRTQIQPLHDIVGNALTTQRRTKAELATGASFAFASREARERLVPIVNSRSPAENFWRYTTMQAVWKALDGSQGHPEAQAWLRVHIDRARMSLEQWTEFWVAHTPSNAMPRTRALGLAEFIQTQGSVQRGNIMDVAHIPHLVNVDYFLTADRRLFKLVNRLRSDFNVELAPALYADQRRSLIPMLRDVLEQLHTLSQQT